MIVDAELRIMLAWFTGGAIGFDVVVEAPVARRGTRLASLITRDTTLTADTQLALAA